MPAQVFLRKSTSYTSNKGAGCLPILILPFKQRQLILIIIAIHKIQ